jgi:MYXO-CTERM domain-containing protein
MGTLGRRKFMIAVGIATIALALATLGDASTESGDGCSCSTEGEPQPGVAAVIGFATAALGLRELLRRRDGYHTIDG